MPYIGPIPHLRADIFRFEGLVHPEVPAKFQRSSMIFVFLMISLSIYSSVCTFVCSVPPPKKNPQKGFSFGIHGIGGTPEVQTKKLIFFAVSVLLSESVERFGVARMSDFVVAKLVTLFGRKNIARIAKSCPESGRLSRC